jgi:hypothetical protein
LPSLRAHADDFDSDPEQRRKLPSFYGYLPDEGKARTIMYVCMVLNGALLLLLRSIGAALLMNVDTKINLFHAYMAGDHLLYLLQKLVRGDFLYWMPMEGVGGLAASLLMRVGAKTLTDFTGIVHTRGAGEMGGAAWLWTMFLSLVAPWVAVPVYFGSLTSNSTNATAIEVDSTDSTTDASELEESDVYVPEESDAWKFLGGMTGLWICAFAVFLRLMKKQYRSTFWRMETGNEYVQGFFLQGGSDNIKKNVLEFNKAKWKAIEPQVKEWVGEGWTEWERGKPDWFTDNWKARVPADWVPEEGQAEHRRARESVRNASVKKLSLFGSANKLMLVREEEEEAEEEEEEDEEEIEEALALAEAMRGGNRVQPVL